jgi:hypothetical protein
MGCMGDRIAESYRLTKEWNGDAGGLLLLLLSEER